MSRGSGQLPGRIFRDEQPDIIVVDVPVSDALVSALRREQYESIWNHTPQRPLPSAADVIAYHAAATPSTSKVLMLSGTDAVDKPARLM